MKTRTLHTLGVVLLVIIAFPFIAHTFPALAGADESYVVLSGSMEPAIQTGSVVFVKDVPAKNIEDGDVITYYTSSSGPPTTHRVIEKTGSEDELYFVTKGDANEEPDPEVKRPEHIVGVVMFHIPYLGYLIQFAGTDLGLIVFLIVPSSLWIASELWELYQATKAEQNNG